MQWIKDSDRKRLGVACIVAVAAVHPPSIADHGDAVLEFYFEERLVHDPDGVTVIPQDMNNDGLIVGRQGTDVVLVRPLIVDTGNGFQFDWHVDNDNDGINDLATVLEGADWNGVFRLNNRGRDLQREFPDGSTVETIYRVTGRAARHTYFDPGGDREIHLELRTGAAVPVAGERG